MESLKTNLRFPSETSLNRNIREIDNGINENHEIGHLQRKRATYFSVDKTGDFPQSTCGKHNEQSICKNSISPKESHSMFQEDHDFTRLSPQTAVQVIENAWISYKNKQMFRLLKYSVLAAESSLSSEILRKIIPREAELLNDKSQQVKVRFRFGGEEFPPLIFFKIFINGAAQKVKYMTGRKLIRPATEAAEDSLRQMGNRTFYDQILKDVVCQYKCPINDEVDITTLKDYMQYLANQDESPACQGGKENYWRKLTLDVLPRRTMFYDVVDFAYNNQITPRLKEEIHILLKRPVTQELQIQQIQAISKLRTQQYPSTQSQVLPKSKMSGAINRSQISSRRSKQARLKALKMKHLYSRENTTEQNNEMDVSFHDGVSEEETGMFQDVEDDVLDKEANKLYEWTQELSFHDDVMPFVTI